MLRFLKLRYLALVLLIWYGATTINMGALLQIPASRHIHATFSMMGYPDASYETTKITLTHLTLKNIVLDFDEATRDPINTIEQLDITFSPLGLLTGRTSKITILRPDILYSADSMPRFDLSAFARLITGRSETEIDIQDMNISYAGENFNPGVSGHITVNHDNQGRKRGLIVLKGEQKDFSVVFKSIVNEQKDGTLTFDIDLPEIRMDIPDVFKIARASGKATLTVPQHDPISLTGQFAAGTLWIGSLPLEHVTFKANGQKPNLTLIGSAGVHGLPDTSFSLRGGENATGAHLLLQFSGNKPVALVQMLGIDLPLPEQQKFSIAAEIKDPSLPNLFARPHQGGVFLYGEDSTPYLAGALSCPAQIFTACAIDIPVTSIPIPLFTAWLGPLLGQSGLTLAGGDLRFGGRIIDLGWARTPKVQFETAINNISGNWRGLALRGLSGTMTRSTTGDLMAGQITARALGGTLLLEKFAYAASSNSGQGVLNARNIALPDLARLMQTKGLSLNGQASASLPFILSNGDILLKTGATVQGRSVQLAYTPGKYPKFLSGSEARIKPLQNALKKYDIDSFRLDIEGSAQKEIKGVFLAQGRNTALYGDQPLHINLKIETPMAPGIARLIAP